MDEMTLKLNSPITDEQWDAITDVDFDNTDRIWFSTKHGKEVELVKVVRCKDCKYGSPNGRYGCKCYHYRLYETHEMYERDFCSRGERK